MISKEISQKNIVSARTRRQPHQSRKHSGYRDYSHVSAAGAPLAFEQQRNAERLVQDAGKGMGRIHGDWCKQRIHFFLTVRVNKRFLFRIEIFQVKHADILTRQRRHQPLVPALVLLLDKLARLQRDQLTFLLRRKRVGTRINETFFNALQEAGDSNFKKFIQIAGRNGKEFHPLQQGIVLVIGFFQHAPVEGKPGSLTIDVKGRI